MPKTHRDLQNVSVVTGTKPTSSFQDAIAGQTLRYRERAVGFVLLPLI